MYLLDKDNNELFKIYVDLGRLAFLGKELRNVSIYQYPIIIFEFMTGYFTTEELFEKNRELGYEFTKDYEIMELPKDLTKSLRPPLQKVISVDSKLVEKANEKQKMPKITSPDTKSYNTNSKEFKAKLDSFIKNQIDPKNRLMSENIGSTFINTATFKNEAKDNLSKSIMPDASKKKKMPSDKKVLNETKTNKCKSTLYSEYVKNYQMLIYLMDPQENIKETNPNFEKELEIFNEGLEKYKRKIRILEMEKEIEFLTKKNEAIKDLNKELEEAIKHKKENLQKVTNQLKPNQINYTNKLNQLKSNLN